MSTMPFVRDLGSYLDFGYYRFTPVSAAFESVARLITASHRAMFPKEGEDRKLEPLLWSAAEVAGYTAGLPNRVMMRAAKSFWDYYDEDKAIPWLYITVGGGFRPKD